MRAIWSREAVPRARPLEWGRGSAGRGGPRRYRHGKLGRPPLRQLLLLKPGRPPPPTQASPQSPGTTSTTRATSGCAPSRRRRAPSPLLRPHPPTLLAGVWLSTPPTLPAARTPSTPPAVPRHPGRARRVPRPRGRGGPPAEGPAHLVRRRPGGGDRLRPAVAHPGPPGPLPLVRHQRRALPEDGPDRPRLRLPLRRGVLRPPGPRLRHQAPLRRVQFHPHLPPGPRCPRGPLLAQGTPAPPR